MDNGGHATYFAPLIILFLRIGPKQLLNSLYIWWYKFFILILLVYEVLLEANYVYFTISLDSIRSKIVTFSFVILSFNWRIFRYRCVNEGIFGANFQTDASSAKPLPVYFHIRTMTNKIRHKTFTVSYLDSVSGMKPSFAEVAGNLCAYNHKFCNTDHFKRSLLKQFLIRKCWLKCHKKDWFFAMMKTLKSWCWRKM